ncbi:MAG: polysaccharide biosynthesis/export family protein, partial [Ferruginibacter sp.]|nr:polysaccharide biosynthesis/export family protein [Chitinophagaceae bacterium]
MRFTRLLLLLVLPFYFFSCTPQQKLPNYLENVRDTSGAEVKVPELRIQKQDLLSIQIYSLATKPEIDQYWNLPFQYTGIGTALGQGVTTGGFLVDANGNIEHPRLGVFHAEGLTKQQLAAEFRKKLTEPVELLNNPTIIIRFLNYQVSVVGEVARPGSILVPGESITILQAIGLAGDITQYGRKNTVKVVREIDGKREIGTIDLSSNALFESPYYNLMQNDMDLVEPAKIKLKAAEQAVIVQKVSLALTI